MALDFLDFTDFLDKIKSQIKKKDKIDKSNLNI